MKILQLSDTHLRGDGLLSFQVADTVKAMNDAMNYFSKMEQQPDLYIVTGDLADNGNVAAYQKLREKLVQLPAPVYIVPGNHDDRLLFREIFPEMCPVKEDIHPYICYTIDDMPIRIIVVDTSIPHTHWGALSEPVADWLDRRVQEYPDKPTLVFTHHPPFITGMSMMDEGFENAERYARILQKHNNLKLCCGHMHCNISTVWHGIPVITSPPISMVMELDLKPGGGDRFFLTDPGYLLHHYCDGRVNTHTCIIPTDIAYSGPHPFAYLDADKK